LVYDEVIFDKVIIPPISYSNDKKLFRFADEEQKFAFAKKALYDNLMEFGCIQTEKVN
jgi:hypothetical protein